MKAQILFIDDDALVLQALRRTLRDYSDRWEMAYCAEPEAAWQELLRTPYDAVVTDVQMPALSGFELLARMRGEPQTQDVPVIILTGLHERSLAERALTLGAVDLLNKPVNLQYLVARLESMLRLKASQDELKAYNARLQERVCQQALDLLQARLNLICRLGNAAECRDEQTGNHVIRVACYCRAMAAAMGMPRAFQERILLTAPLHDIGKIGIPDQILLKPGSLTAGEWAVMQRHCVIGEQILRADSRVMGTLLQGVFAEQGPFPQEDPLLEMAARIALTHHEKWDGSGYPHGLLGEAIPLEARIVAVADVFDALTSARPYKAAVAEEEALRILRATVGSHFAPDAHQGFEKALPEILQIHADLADGRTGSDRGEELP